jgi:hypothetical protein
MFKGLRPAHRLACLAGLLLWLSSAEAGDGILVAHLGVDADAVSLNTTRLLFSMQLRTWPDGSAVRVFVLPDDNPVHRAFAKDQLSLYPRQLRRVWDRQLYSGTGQVPDMVASEVEMRARVATTPGAIGYLSSEMIDDTVRVLKIR